MDKRVLFMILDNQVLYLDNSTMDHREWYLSLGKDPNVFEDVVRGFIMNHKIVFYKGINFHYDEQVVQEAIVHSSKIKEDLQDPSLEFYCGVVVHSYGEKWEPILRLTEEDLAKNIVVEQPKKEEKNTKKVVESGPILELQNDYQDEKFLKFAFLFTIVIFILSVLSIIIYKVMNPRLGSRLDSFTYFLLIMLFLLTLFGYKRNLAMTKYVSLVTCLVMFFTFRLPIILLGIVYFLFTVNHKYIMTIWNLLIRIIQKFSQKNQKKS